MAYRQTGFSFDVQPPITPTPIAPHLKPGPNGTVRVAVVGNGPLNEEDRPLIEQYENVVRFNDMKTWLPHEKVTLHAARARLDEWRRNTAMSYNKHGWNATKWALSWDMHDIPDDADLVTWSVLDPVWGRNDVYDWGHPRASPPSLQRGSPPR